MYIPDKKTSAAVLSLLYIDDRQIKGIHDDAYSVHKGEAKYYAGISKNRPNLRARICSKPADMVKDFIPLRLVVDTGHQK